MKWLSNRYAYPLVIFVIILSIALQVAWLSQLFDAQRVQVKRELDGMTGKAAEISTYLSVLPGHEQSKNFRDFFLSPEWLQLRQAYNNMRFNNIGSRFNSDTKGDSTFVDISLRFYNGNTKGKHYIQAVKRDNGETIAHLKAQDQKDLFRMDSIVQQKLTPSCIQLNEFHIIYNFDTGNVPDSSTSFKLKQAEFISQKYSYNLRFLATYQLVVPSLTNLVLYRMRYYLISSCLMLLLTGAVFLFILRLMRNQRIYAQARVSFTSNMTHELKTPVATVAIALESIIENHMENDPQALRNYLEIGRNELRRLNLMIDKVLNLEELDFGHTRLRTELFDVQQGIQDVITSMRLQIENSGAILTWKPFPLPCFVSGDPVHLTNVFYNLIENALKYGGPNLKLEITCIVNTHEVKISFKDNGPGIAEIYHQRIFDRFFRVPSNNANVHNVKGSGLGLNYVKQIIEKHLGYIKLNSEPGNGSQFILYLPVVS